MIWSRANKITFRGIVKNRDAATPLLEQNGDVVLVERGKPRLIVMRCPCGCGDDLLINLDEDAGQAWRHYRTSKGLTLYPSYWRANKCCSHFIVWNSSIYWCYGCGTERSDEWRVSSWLEGAVYELLSDNQYISYERVAEVLKIIPWDILQACQQLQERGLAVRKKGSPDEYRRVKPKSVGTESGLKADQ